MRSYPKLGAATCTLLFCCVLLIGCGKPGLVDRESIGGKVTYGDNQPVPHGMITFTPDTSQGNSGPQGFAAILNGEYQTKKSGRGAVTGPQIVQIDGYNEPYDPASESPAKPLFPSYQTKVTIDENTSTLDFKVPVK